LRRAGSDDQVGIAIVCEIADRDPDAAGERRVVHFAGEIEGAMLGVIGFDDRRHSDPATCVDHGKWQRPAEEHPQFQAMELGSAALGLAV